MLFGLSHREKKVKKMNLLHFPYTLKNFLILELPEPLIINMLLLQIPTTQ